MDNTHLLIHGITLSKDNIASDEASHKGVKAALFALVQLLLHEEQCLVNGDEFGQVEGMLLRRTEDDLGPRLPTIAV